MVALTQRQKIVNWLRNKLESEGFFVTRKLLQYEDLDRTKLPAVIISNGPESCTSAAQDDRIEAIWEPHILVFIKSVNEEPQDILEETMGQIVRAVCSDPFAGGTVEDVDISEKDTDRSVFCPFAAGDIVFRFQYTFERKKQGG